VTEEGFGLRLRRERERRQIPLESIAAKTKISLALFAALESDDVSRWPSGIFRRSFIRAYASAIGLDVDAVTREFLDRFPDPADQLPAPGATPESTAPSSPTALRLTLADATRPFMGGRLLPRPAARLAAVGCDVGAVMAISVAMFVATGEFWMPLAISTLCYYVAGILALGNTPGVCLFAPGSHKNTVDSAPAPVPVPAPARREASDAPRLLEERRLEPRQLRTRDFPDRPPATTSRAAS
jgi:transcriptional regulator with XRE-family HTH domain